MKRALLLLMFFVLALPATAAAADQARLESIVQDVPGSTAHRYAVKDNLGNGMDTLKIIDDPRGGYFGVYHVLVSGKYHVYLATSSDLLNWTFRSDLASNASQPTIKALEDGGFLFAYEQDTGCTGTGTGGNCLRLLYYQSPSALLTHTPGRSFQVARTLSSCAEGTPNIYWANLQPDIDHSTIGIGFHYYRDCQVDRQAAAVLTDFKSWNPWVASEPSNTIEDLGAKGNIGDRDSVVYGYTQYRLVEGQLVNRDFSSWRPFIYSRWTGAKQLNIRTNSGSKAFANPTITMVKAPGGGSALVITMYIPATGAAQGEAGELVYYKKLTAADTTTPGASPCGSRPNPPSLYERVLWITFENHSYGSVIGSSNAPYTNTLANQCGLATNFFAETHPSLPNYIAMTSGSTQGVTDDSGPGSHPLSVPSIFSQLDTAWKSLEESMPSNCYKSNSGDYAVRHNPAAYYTNVNCAEQDVPLGPEPDLSARFTFVTPDLCSDTHDCSVNTGDTWLSEFMPSVLSSPQYLSGKMVIFITWDEDGGNALNHIPTLVVSPYTAAGTKAPGLFNHYSMLGTTEELLGLPKLGFARLSPSMQSSFGL